MRNSMMIRMTVFWTVCTPNHIAMHNLKCAIQRWSGSSFELRIGPSLNCAFQITHRDVICRTDVHMVQNTVFRILIQKGHFKLKFKLRTLLSCENSQCNINSNTALRLEEIISISSQFSSYKKTSLWTALVHSIDYFVSFSLSI